MKHDIGYQFLDSGQRTDVYKECLIKALSECNERTQQQMTVLFESQQEQIENSFCKAMAAVNDDLLSCISLGRKGKICFINISYLLSGALSGEMLLKLDFYDKRYYSDPEELDCFWDCHELFPQYEAELKQIIREMREQVVQVKSNEISKAGIYLTACNYLMLKPILEKLVRSESFTKLIEPYCDHQVYISYGAYLDESEVIHQIKGEV